MGKLEWLSYEVVCVGRQKLINDKIDMTALGLDSEQIAGNA